MAVIDMKSRLGRLNDFLENRLVILDEDDANLFFHSEVAEGFRKENIRGHQEERFYFGNLLLRYSGIKIKDEMSNVPYVIDTLVATNNFRKNDHMKKDHADMLLFVCAIFPEYLERRFRGSTKFYVGQVSSMYQNYACNTPLTQVTGLFLNLSEHMPDLYKGFRAVGDKWKISN